MTGTTVLTALLVLTNCFCVFPLAFFKIQTLFPSTLFLSSLLKEGQDIRDRHVIAHIALVLL